ncbi:M48 family metallopeptidase [Neobacillus niacini]|uniref:M48 family metallopeptidase n=1 Tax=Neobacillus niacini TaxID=86668 RepID=UPI00203C7311|nr:SprT family zinc-dependent metalloprotease [Neobacillus niacini]MCM3693439.1 M48 family metallopeptidase [Neobacillus niacini]
MIHTYLGQSINFEIKYKRRTSMSIHIDGTGYVEVHVPKGISDGRVILALEEKWDWIQLKLKEMKDRTLGPTVKTYEHGESFLYLGKEYPIQITQDTEAQQDYARFEEEKLHIVVKQLEDEKVKQALKRFYYQQCKMLVEKSIRSYQSNFKVKPRSIRITDNKTNWGTCDSKQQLTFNWRLGMAPQKVIDYVVVHEMCHMVHLNHDRSFWRLVGKIIPDYEEQENWLALSSWKMTV